jgi:hypothetical protein
MTTHPEHDELEKLKKRIAFKLRSWLPHSSRMRGQMVDAVAAFILSDRAKAIAEAEQALYDAMLGVIGEDEVHTIPVGAALNGLRAEQRKALNAIFGRKVEKDRE